ncbi:MAG: HAD family hydrolase [Bacilli bacterium]|nr:HAD family hydrolase [Bacilli bacterium]
MSKKAILFDLDGTLWDSTKQTVISFHRIIKEKNIEFISEERIKNNFGNNKEETIKNLFPNLSYQEGEKLLNEIDEDIIKNLNMSCDCIYEGVKEVLEKLHKDYQLFIITNNSHKTYIEAFLKGGNFSNFFKDYIAASAIPISKSEAIKKLMNENEIEKGIYVGDTKKDRDAAKAANVPFIQCLYGFGEDLKEIYKIDNIQELPECIKKIG